MIPTLLLTLALTAAPAAAAPASLDAPATLVLVVASNRGARPGRAPLQYADDDGAKYYEVLASIAGEENTILLTDFDRDTARLFPGLLDRVRSPTRAQLDLAASRLGRRAAELRLAHRPVRFLFVFAGHGDVDGGRGFLELADGAFTADDVQALLRTVDATESHVILDSCNSFFVVSPRKPGGTRFATPKDAAEALGRRLPNVGVFLSTSAQAEVFEWSELQSGVFSHAVRSGLMGAADANGDGRVSYEELAGFVETAVADIKNPLYRPTVYARGPNGQDARTLVDLPAASRVALTVDEPGAVRLALRDTDGLRWLDAYKEAGATLRLWVPPSLTRRLEVDRLKTGRSDRGQIDATFSLAEDAGTATRFASLVPSGPAVAMRGAGEIFQALFSRPFGPAALAAYLDQREAPGDAILAEPRAAAGLGEPDPGAPLAPNASSASPETGRSRVFAVLRPGIELPWLASHQGFQGGSPGRVSGLHIGASAGLDLGSVFAIELDAAYADTTSSSWKMDYFHVPAVVAPIVETSIRLQVLTLAVNARWQLPLRDAHPYLVLGGGVAPTQATFAPRAFYPTLRATRFLPFAQGGAGIVFDVGKRLFVGAEGRYLLFADLQAFGDRLGISGVSATALLGARLP